MHYKTVTSVSTCAIFVMLNWTSLRLLLGTGSTFVCPVLFGHVSWGPIRGDDVERGDCLVAVFSEKYSSKWKVLSGSRVDQNHSYHKSLKTVMNTVLTHTYERKED